MKKIVSVIALLLALLICVAGCGKKAPAENPGTPPDAPSSNSPGDANSNTVEDGEFPNYVIGHNVLSAGDWSNDVLLMMDEFYLGSIGATVNAVSANFSSEQMLKDVQNMLAAGEDGHMYVGSFGTLTPTVSDLFLDNEVYFAMYDQFPLDSMLDQLNANPYYTGTVGPDSVMVATILAEEALAQGRTKAAIMGGAIGDVVHDLRIATFTEVFEAGGGTVVATVRVSGADEAVTKIDDLMAAYGHDIDCFYGVNMTGTHAALNAMKNYELTDVLCLASEVDIAGLELIQEGKLIGDAHAFQSVAFTNALLVNAMDGHAILDENGNAPYLKTTASHFIITEDKVDNYQKYWLEGYPLTEEDYKTLLYRHNPDVSYDSIVEFMDGFTYDYVVNNQN